MKKIAYLLFLPLLLFGCTKDKLEGDLDQLEGRYTWSHSWHRVEWWHTNLTYVNAATKAYIAEFELDNEGKMHFYINGECIHRTGFGVEGTEPLENGALSVTLDPHKERTESFDLNNELHLTIHADTLSIGGFPGPTYDSDFGGTGYFVRN